jgi:hypothetical protein
VNGPDAIPGARRRYIATNSLHAPPCFGVAGAPRRRLFSLTPAEVVQRSFCDPATFGVDPAKLSPQARAAMAMSAPRWAFTSAAA